MANEQLNVSVPAALARYVRGRIKSGRYGDTSELFQEALRALRREEDGPSPADFVLTPEEDAVARLAVRRGLDDIRQGRYRALDADGLRKLGKDIVSRTARKVR